MCSRTKIAGPLHSLAEVARLDCPDSCGRADHRVAFSAGTIVAIIATAAPQPTQIVMPSSSISMPDIRLGLASRCLALMADPTAGTMASTDAGTNDGASAIAAGNPRACNAKRQRAGQSRKRRGLMSASPRRSSGTCRRGEPMTPLILAARRHGRLKRMIKDRHKQILQKDCETRLSHLPREGGSGTTPTKISTQSRCVAVTVARLVRATAETARSLYPPLRARIFEVTMRVDGLPGWGGAL
ncbi:hypothetical protein ABIA99_007373 [Bradyrhizobium sp. LB12.1]